MTNTDYQAICRENAERFLKTAFVLDDIPEKVDRVIKQKVVSLTRPSKGVSLTPSDDEGPTEIPETPLDCKILTEMFMRKGIFCSIIQPKDKDNVISLEDNLIDAIENVDLPILDWNLFKDDNGDTIISILKHLMELRSYPEGRVSLILIYTREPIPGAMRRLQDEFNRRLIPDQDRENVLAMKGLRIILVDRRSIVEEKLPDFIINEFSEAHRGILENGVIQAISEIREKTYHVLNRFPAELDAPFLSNRAALSVPNEGDDQAVDLITSEIRSLLMQSDLSPKICDEQIIASVLDSISDNRLDGLIKNKTKTTTPEVREELTELLRNGINPYDRFKILMNHTSLTVKQENRQTLIGELTELLANSGTTYLDERLSELFSFQNKYPDYPPQLTLGTLIYKASGSESPGYFLCILPYCDSVRLKGTVSVPFLPLNRAKDSNSRFDLTINHLGEWQKLRVDYSPSRISKWKFSPSTGSDGKILAKGMVFKTRGRIKLEWVGTLKREFAQRVANKFGAHISRVGLSESEWQREHAEK